MTNKTCMLCSGKNISKALFECLNCENTLLCEGCKAKHQKNPRHKTHKIVNLKSAFEGPPGVVKIEE